MRIGDAIDLKRWENARHFNADWEEGRWLANDSVEQNHRSELFEKVSAPLEKTARDGVDASTSEARAEIGASPAPLALPWIPTHIA